MTSGDVQETPGPQAGGLDYLPVLGRLQDAFHAAIGAADPTAPVPACGDWTVRELVEHLAGVHHWAGSQARAERTAPLGDGPFDLAPHYAEQAARLRDTLGALSPDATARVLTHPEPLGAGPVSFWHRRQVHETLIHLHDLRAAAAGRVDVEVVADVGPEIWADAVDEVVTVFQPRQVGLGRMRPLDVHVLLEADDVAGGRSWVLGFPDHDRSREIVPDATVTGPARALALLLWRRATPEEAGVAVEGERGRLDRALAAPIVP